MDQRVLVTAGASVDRARDRAGCERRQGVCISLWCACDSDAWSRQLQVNHMAEGRNRLELSSQKRVRHQRRCYAKQSSCVLVFDAAGQVLFPVSGDDARTRDGHIVAWRLGAPRSQSSQVGFWVLCNRCSRPLGVLARLRVIRAISSRPLSQGLPEYVEHGDQEDSYASGSEHSDKDGRAHTPPRDFRSAACPHQWH